MTTLRLAVALNEHFTVQGLSPDHEPRAAILCSYEYVYNLDRWRPRLAFRNWSMDSGAYTAWAQGKVIDLTAYIESCRERLVQDDDLVEVFALDAIGDPNASRMNVERMWSEGIPAIPTFHYGEPEELLSHYAATYPKIALGGTAVMKGPTRHQWVRQCFARVWPKLVHGFGVTTQADVLCVPWDSVDSSSWYAPTQFGVGKAYGQTTRMRTYYRNLARAEVEWYLDLERKAQARWSRPLAEARQATAERFPGYPARVVA